jgi:hypothetical protein
VASTVSNVALVDVCSRAKTKLNPEQTRTKLLTRASGVAKTSVARRAGRAETMAGCVDALGEGVAATVSGLALINICRQ